MFTQKLLKTSLQNNRKNSLDRRTDMRSRNSKVFLTSCLALTVALVTLSLAKGQSQEMQERIAEIKQAAAMNKQMLAQYTWTEQDIISIKGEEKKEELYNVQLGPDGKPQKTPIDPSSVSDEERRRRGLRGRVIEKKTEEYKEYADSIKTLIEQYVPPDREMLQQAYQQGNIMIGPQAGAPGEYKVVISNYIKPGDNMTLVMDRAEKDLVSLSIATYLNDPKNAVNVNVEFTGIPGGPNHVSSETINGVSKELTIAIQNSNYQRM